MGDEYLAGLYKEALVTADRGHVDVWKELKELRKSPFLEYQGNREALLPYFFLIAPIQNADTLELPFNTQYHPSDYGLEHPAYKALTSGSKEKGALRLLAKGEPGKKRFTIHKVPEDLLEALNSQEETVCAHALADKYGAVRTATFFRYDTKGDKACFEPLEYKGEHICGKGILSGGWPELKAWDTGGMRKSEYDNERYCPVNIGASHFKDNGNDFYITYRRLSTDLRLDMPISFTCLNENDGFEELAKNLGASLNYDLKHSDKIRLLLRNLTAGGKKVDYADVQTGRHPFSDGTDKREVLEQDVFRVLYDSAVTSAYGKDGLVKLLKGKKFSGPEKEKIAERYGPLCKDFIGALDERNREHFANLKNPAHFLSYLQ